MNVYEEDLRMRQVAPGLRKLIKLRVEHIRLTPRDRMRVKLAMQVSYLIIVYGILCCRLLLGWVISVFRQNSYTRQIK